MLDMLNKNVEIFDRTSIYPVIGTVSILDGKTLIVSVNVSAASAVIDGAPPHVRAFTTLPKYLSYYIHERKLLSFKKDIRRITGTPADIYGLTGNGFIKESYDAELVLLSKDQIREDATYADTFIPNEDI